MTKPIAELIAELKQLGAKATPGPMVIWEHTESDGYVWYRLRAPSHRNLAHVRSTRADADLICAAVNNIPAILTAYEEQAAKLDLARKALEKLNNWALTDAVQGSGDYDQGLVCGVEDRGYQSDGYSAMRYGYDRALERVSEEIDGTIMEALAALTPNPPTNEG